MYGGADALQTAYRNNLDAQLCTLVIENETIVRAEIRDWQAPLRMEPIPAKNDERYPF
jgi:hypothetical protein